MNYLLSRVYVHRVRLHLVQLSYSSITTPTRLECALADFQKTKHLFLSSHILLQFFVLQAYIIHICSSDVVRGNIFTFNCCH